MNHKKFVQKHNHQLTGSEEYFKESIIEEETLRIVHKVINELPPQSRKIILFSLQNMTNPEIAAKLNVSLNTIKTLKLKSYRFLRENLNKYLFLVFSLL